MIHNHRLIHIKLHKNVKSFQLEKSHDYDFHLILLSYILQTLYE
jgi:hypothetical protein